MNIILLTLYAFIGWKYGNWKEFKSFYPTLLFLIIGDLLYQFLLYDHTMWKFHAVGRIEEQLNFNHTIIALSKMAIQYPVTIAVFLGRLSYNKKQQILSILLWSGIYILTGWTAHVSGVLRYYNGWSFGWDVLFNLMMFTMLFIHHKKPLLAWILTVPIVLGLWWIFEVPYAVLK